MATRSIIRRCLLWLVTGLPACLYAQGITIGAGANVVVSGPLKIWINNGSLINNGGFVPDSSTAIFTGSSPSGQSTIGGTSWLPFYNLTIAKSANDVQQTVPTYVANILQMQKGNLLLMSNNLDLGLTGRLAGESDSSEVFGIDGGNISGGTNLAFSGSTDPHNLGLEIISPNVGAIFFYRGNYQMPLDGSTVSIYRYYDIVLLFPEENHGLNASLKFHYLNFELGGLSKSSLNMWTSPDYGSDWNFLGQDAADTVHNWVYKTGFDSLKRYTLGPPPASMSPSLVFGGNLVDGQTNLNWILTNNPMADHFELERSPDGHSFSKLSDIAAYSRKSRSNTYYFTDPSPFNGLSYYRLKEVNRGNTFVYTRTIVIKTGVAVIYPNPAHDVVSIRFTAGSSTRGSLLLFNGGGQVVARKDVECQPGINTISWDLKGLPSGTYHLEFNNLPVAAARVVIQ